MASTSAGFSQRSVYVVTMKNERVSILKFTVHVVLFAKVMQCRRALAMLDRSLLFDAQRYARDGCIPWSFLAWPSAIDDADGLPRHAGALRFLTLVQQKGVRFGTWRVPVERSVRQTWAVVRFEDRGHVIDAIAAIEDDGHIASGFVDSLTAEWFGENDAE